MSSATATTLTLHAAINAARSLLVAPLAGYFPASVLDTVHLALMTSLATHLLPTWDPSRPSRGSAVRALLLCPQTLPPKPIREAAANAGVKWSDWILLLSRGEEWELTIDPGRVAVRVARTGAETVVWKEDITLEHVAPIGKRTPWGLEIPPTPRASGFPSAIVAAAAARKASLIEEPEWLDSLLSQFPEAPAGVSTSPASVRSSSDYPFAQVNAQRAKTLAHFLHSRTPSSVSTSPSEISEASVSSLFSVSPPSSSISISEASSAGSPCPSPSPAPSVLAPECEIYDFDEEELTPASYYVDTKRTEVTEYECGKVGVLGGGVMLGARRVF